MEIKLNGIEYVDETQNAQAIIDFIIYHSDIGSAHFLGIINDFNGELCFGLFSGVGGDFSLLQEFESHCDETTQHIIKRIANIQNFDADNTEDMTEFLYKVESQAHHIVPNHIYNELREIRRKNEAR
jgi:hypothetical protein